MAEQQAQKAETCAQPSQIIRSVREHAGLSQRQLADRLGTTSNTISRWERGDRDPTARDLVKAVEACGCELIVLPGEKS